MPNLFTLFRNRISISMQIMSDLHLEVGQQYDSFEMPVAAPYLLLAGDIGRLIDYDAYLRFLARQTAGFERVFLVLGNHEFYGLDYTKGLEQAKKLEMEPILQQKLILLHRKRYDFPGVPISILGCTMWSRIAEEAHDIVTAKVKDFQKIENWAVESHNHAHEADLSWLKREIKIIQQENGSKEGSSQSKFVVVATHHAPCAKNTSSPKDEKNPWSSAFATDLILPYDWRYVKYWVYGHTHYTNEFNESNIKVISNQRGYMLPSQISKSEDIQKHTKHVFNLKKVIDISC